MSKKVFFGQNDLRYLYYRYKDSVYYSLSIFIGTILVCILLLINVIIPQIGKYLSIRNEVISQREKIKIINDNINLIGNLNKTELDKQLHVATSALPPEQDISGILNAISETAVRSGVTVDDFNFILGEVPSSTKVTEKSPVYEFVSVNIKLKIIGNISRTKRFLEEIAQKVPISEISEFDYNTNITNLEIKFYYKLFPNIAFKDDISLVPVSLAARQLLDKLATWQTVQAEESITEPIGSESAVPIF